VLLELDYSSDVAIYQQIRNQIVMGIANGLLKPGDKLPTIRALAEEAGINMMTVNKAYALLKQEGYIVADRRSGAKVAEAAAVRGLSERSIALLRVIASEARLSGIGRTEFQKLCSDIYENPEGN
jgi:DNA-binding transcriptional regulator YhcF (GntR family)